jgi:alpha-D-ribose 1-methylphosphonate 5-triphosphate diphosphatase
MNHVFRSLRVLISEGIVPLDLEIENGLISNISSYGSLPEAKNLGSLLITPGFVDLHSDAIEKEIEPRPGASFPVENAISELDKKLAMSGITTMFHAVGFNDQSIVSQRGTKKAEAIIKQIFAINRQRLSVDNLVHARYEITSFNSRPVLENLINQGCIQLLSVMDHTPGQGQFKSIETWKRFHMPTYDLSDEQAESIIKGKKENRSRAYDALQGLLSLAAGRDLQLLSHDDDTCEKIDLVREMGISISEFPLDKRVAGYARSKGLGTGMGAPNVVRGMSQSGNISAQALIREDICDFLCSDYHPSSMLQAPYVLHNSLGTPLEKGFSLITSGPARLAKLDDRGEITVGRKADLLVIDDRWLPKVVGTVKDGEIIYTSGRCFCSKDSCLAHPFHAPVWQNPVGLAAAK